MKTSLTLTFKYENVLITIMDDNTINVIAPEGSNFTEINETIKQFCSSIHKNLENVTVYISVCIF
jgi:hypothetical protein